MGDQLVLVLFRDVSKARSAVGTGCHLNIFDSGYW